MDSAKSYLNFSTQESLLYSSTLGFILGVLFASLYSISNLLLYLVVASFFLILLLALIYTRIQKTALIVSVFLFCIVTGILRVQFESQKISEVLLPEYNNERVEIVGIIYDEPDVRETNQKIVLRVDSVDGKSLKPKEKVLVTMPVYERVYYGDTLVLTGTIEVPENFENEFGQTFDYISYLKKDGIHTEIRNPTYKVIEEGGGSWLKRKLFSYKSFFLSISGKYIPHPESALLGGLIVGTKQSLGEDLKNAFIKTGTIHIVALSGYNVTLVAEGIMRLLGTVFIKGISIYVGIISIILFALMTGAGATVVRASIMAILVLIARATGKTYQITRALIFAGCIMVLVNPWILVFDVSFQLSFLATIGLIHLTPHVKMWCKKIPSTLGFRELVSATIATNIFVLPFILYKMGIFSLVSIPVNILILPVVPIIMFLGFVVFLLGSFIGVLAIPFGYLAYWLLHYQLTLISWSSTLPFASFVVPPFSLSLLVISYVLLIWYMIKHKISPIE